MEELVIKPAAPADDGGKEELAAAPPPAVKEEKKAAPLPASGVGDKLRATFSRPKRTYKDELKEVLAAKEEKPAALAQWSKKSFADAPEIGAVAAGGNPAQYGAAAKLKGFMHRHPLLSISVILIALGIAVVDILVLTRHLSMGRLRAIAFGGDTRPVIPAAPMDSRDSGLSLLERGLYAEGEKTDAGTASAIQGTNQLAGGLRPAGLPAGLGGIANPEDEDDKKKLKMLGSISLDASGMDTSGSVSNMGRTQIKKSEQDDFTPYGGSAPGDVKTAKAPTGVYFGDAGENLDNFADVGGVRNSGNGAVKAVDNSEFPTVPEGLRGAELVKSMVGDDLMQEMKNYAKEGTWRMRRAPGAKQNVPGLPADGMAGSFAASQLLETKRLTDRALNCPTCKNEDRINLNRATFYGEKY
ncbi:MAG: hypothetical protein ABIJ96_16120 [Elusimicrobiota bacterium]